MAVQLDEPEAMQCPVLHTIDTVSTLMPGE